MEQQFPIRLVGVNLGERHRYLNELVAQHKHKNFDIIKETPEKSTMDRIFKIELAVNTENVDYILENLKDEDMLYVSRSLKAKWLLNKKYEKIINPAFLEDVLYPEMMTTAVNKMKHWIHLNLNDEERCQKFFSYYNNSNRKLALKFLPKCSKDFIVNEFPKIVNNTTPQLMKMLCEKTPIVAKLFFEILQTDKAVATIYDEYATQFFNSIKCIMKVDPEIYLDILEHHYRNGSFRRLSAAATEFILSEKRDMFWKKPELYTSWFCDVKSVAKSLSSEECEKLVLLFARSKFLDDWFDYKTMEPFIKRLDVTKRAQFKKRVFVQKDIGDEIKEWPYPLPVYYPALDDRSTIIEDDENYGPARYMLCSAPMALCMKSRVMMADCGFNNIYKPKTDLDKLFDQYRFKNFNETLHELCKNIKSLSSSQSRMHVFLVLISKSGGRLDNLGKLFELLLKHSNEPVQVRAAVVRSLVQRASVWRVDDNLWQQMLTYGHGLGLDGSPSEIDCHEGLHAVVIRNILTGSECSPAIKKAYLNNFSTFKDYSLTGDEKKTVIEGIQKLLINAVYEDSDKSLAAINYLLDILKANNVRVDYAFINAVKSYLSRDVNSPLLKRLYDAKIGRKEFHSYNFVLFTTEAACVNALKHDTSVLIEDKVLEVLKNQRLDHFFCKIQIYFQERESFGGIFLRALMKEKPDRRYARPIVRLIGDKLNSYIVQIDGEKGDSTIQRYAADVRANAHVCRPKMDLNNLKWKTAGVKFLANRIIICKTIDINKNIEKLVTWKRSVKLAALIAQRIKKEHKVFPILAKSRPTVAFKFGLMYLKHHAADSDIRVWESFATLINKLESSIVTHSHLQVKARKISQIPIDYRPQYIALLYPILKKIKIGICLPPLNHIKQLLSKMDATFVENVLMDFFTNDFNVVKRLLFDYGVIERSYSTLHIEILGKFMLLCKDKETQDKRFENIALVFLQKLEPHIKAGSQEAFVIYDKFINDLTLQEKDEIYVSSMPVLENIIMWMRNAMPMEKYFKYYVQVHLGMELEKATKHCRKQYPELYADKTEKRKEANDILGEIFGRYIAVSTNELKLKYFDSIIDLYGKSLGKYLSEFSSIRKNCITLGVIKGILERSTNSERRLVLHLIDYPALSNDVDKEKANKMIKESHDEQIKFYYNSSLIDTQMSVDICIN